MKVMKFFLCCFLSLGITSCQSSCQCNGEKKPQEPASTESALTQQSALTEELEPTLTLQAPMRDGTELPVDIYFPHGMSKEEASSTRYPCVLVRAPYGRKGALPECADLLDWGYVVAIQDTRMVMDEKGRVLPYMSDGFGPLQDGYDTVEWLAAQEFCDGNIGTVGDSALGITQLLMAPTAPPHLRCQFIGNAAPSLYHYAIYYGGQLRATQVKGWLSQYSKNEECMYLIRQQPEYNPFWAQLDALAQSSKVQAPAVHQGGWYDTFLQGTIDSFVNRQENGAEGAKGQQKLVIGPWTHHNYSSGKETLELGEFSVPEEGRQKYLNMGKKAWFDHFLKKENSTIAELPPVTYFVMGPLDGTSSKGNTWRHAEQWPVPAKETSFFLSANGGLDTQTADKETTVAFDYNPADPTPTCGGRNLFLPGGPRDQREVESREDTLVFTSSVLMEDTEVTGRIRAKIFLETDQKDTDVAVRLCDVYPDGRSVLIADGLTRLSSIKDPSLRLEDCVEVDVDLWSTSQVFAKGHQIRVSISGANYPRYERNLNIGWPEDLQENASGKVAHNKVHTSSKRPSRVILPIVRS